MPPYTPHRMPYPLPPDPSTEQRDRIARWVSFAFAAVLVALVTYLGYVAFEGSRQLSEAPAPTTDCRTPATMGWAYEAINYDIATDAELATVADPKDCARQGAPAGDAVRAGDVSLAGWYVPAAGETGPTGPTVVLAHGWGSNKSNMLDRASLLHERYNLLLVDFRNHGQSSEAPTTQGVREADELRAMIDWLAAEKAPDSVAVLGVSMGGATALAAASRDDRIDAVIVESVHATLANAAEARLSRSGYPLALPGSWAILLGSLVRTGEDLSAVDPLQSVARLDERPLLIIDGGADDSIGAEDPEALLAAAEKAGSPAELQVCEAAGHGQVNEVCSEVYAGWVLGFLERVLAPGG